MPAFEMTAAEAEKYGINLNIWEQIQLLSAWSPLLGYGQRFVKEADPYTRSLIVAEACEWLASKTNSGLDDQLVRLLADMVKTPQGEELVRWIVSKIEGLKA